MTEKPIYLDNNATTQLDPKVFKAMLLDFQGPPLNPSSIHSFGREAKRLLTEAREKTASFFKADPKEIVFTSGGTESNNFFLRGIGRDGHIITSMIEHSSIYKTVQSLEGQGMRATYIPVGVWGAPLPEEIAAAIRPDTRAIALSAANSETGVKIDLKAIAEIAHRAKIPLLVDAVSFIGKEPWIMHPGISAVSISGHKFHGPKGVGALFLRSSCKLLSQHTGGAQEYLHRAGTENLAGILGLGEALSILSSDQIAITNHLSDLRLHLESGLRREIPDLQINGEGPRISNTSSISFPGIDGESLLIHLDMAGILASHGSACASGAMEPSRVLTAMGIPYKIASSSLRFSVGRYNTREEIDQATQKISAIVKKLSRL